MIPKFKAWDTIRKKMWSAEEMAADQLTLMPDGTGFINVNGTSTKLSQLLPHLIPLQSTGLTDKNGKEIYEGDIVSYSQKSNGVIQFNSFQARWEIFWAFGDIYRIEKHWSETELEVIGNIYNNSKLLEEIKSERV